MTQIKYKLWTEEMVGDDEFISIEADFLPRVGEEIFLDHPDYSGDHIITSVQHSCYPTLHSINREEALGREGKSRDIDYEMHDPDVHLERKKN